MDVRFDRMANMNIHISTYARFPSALSPEFDIECANDVAGYHSSYFRMLKHRRCKKHARPFFLSLDIFETIEMVLSCVLR